MPTALITGASAGLGLAIAEHLAARAQPWALVLTARDGERLTRATAQAARRTSVTTVVGDVSDRAHRARLAEVAPTLDLLVNNASTLGPSPLPRLADLPPEAYREVLDTNVIAPLTVFQSLRASLVAARGVVINISSDAARGAWEGWGGYGSSKAALDQLTAVLGEEEPSLAVYALDPGDMRTEMHQGAFPGEDISDRPLPKTVAPAVLGLVRGRPPSGRYLATEVLHGAPRPPREVLA